MSENRISRKDLYRQLVTIKPDMDPAQVVENIRKLNELEYNETKIPVIEKQREQLSELGYNPDEWIFYSPVMAHVSEDRVFRVEDLLFVRRDFPEGLDLLVVAGEYSGGLNMGDGDGFSAMRYRYNPDGYTAFIRVKPPELPPTIESVRDQT